MVLSQHDPHGARLRLQGADVRLRHRPDRLCSATKQLAARVINACVDKITLREPDSRETLSDFGVTAPEVILASDPALTLQAAERGRIDRILRDARYGPRTASISASYCASGPALRKRPPCVAAGAVYAYLKYGLTPVFLSINFRTDGEASQLVTEHLSIPFHVLGEQMSTGEVIGVLSRMTAVVSMRLHGLIFAAGQGVPLIGVAYDPKVTAFLDYVEQNNYIQLRGAQRKGPVGHDRLGRRPCRQGRGDAPPHRTAQPAGG
ncbi:MAG: polysaccharide pyruvyl transferase family protein [Oscillospiraceae bacterium]